MSKRSMKSHHATVGKSNVWLTPRWILDPLGKFSLDPCSAPSPRPWDTAISHIELPEDGLTAQWVGRVWLNPPFDRRGIAAWLEKMADHGNGIALIPAATETKHFADFVWKRASSVLFLNKRPHFHRPDGSRASANSGCAIVLAGYGSSNDQILSKSGLGFYFKIGDK